MTNPDLDKYAPLIALELLKTHEGFRSDIIKIGDPIINEINSYLQNPNCSCKNTIGKFFVTNRSIITSIINNWVIIDKTIDIETIIQANKANDVTGRVFIIEPTESAYKEFLNNAKLQKYQYRGFQIVPKDDKWCLVFY
jgi:hypothetical protein